MKNVARMATYPPIACVGPDVTSIAQEAVIKRNAHPLSEASRNYVALLIRIFIIINFMFKQHCRSIHQRYFDDGHNNVDLCFFMGMSNIFRLLVPLDMSKILNLTSCLKLQILHSNYCTDTHIYVLI